MASDAFVRARRFLRFSPGAAWGALCTSFVLSLLIIFLLVMLGLFTDLVVSGGKVAALTEADRPWLIETLGENEAEAAMQAVAAGQPVGMLSLLVRTHQTHPWYEPLVAFPVEWFAWTRSNGSYLTGLLVLTILLAMLWSGLVLLMHYLATVATVEAAIRLRRAVYHQTYRLGTLAFRALGTSEAIGIFTRHLEAVVEGLYARLTVMFADPARIFTLLTFAIVVEWSASGGFPLLTVAYVLFALLFWIIEGQLAAYSRQQERRNLHQATEQLALLQESLQMLRLVKCYLMEAFNQSRVERQLTSYTTSLENRFWSTALFTQVLVLMGILAGALLLYAAGWNILSGNLGVAATLTVTATLACMYWPIWRWFNTQRTMRRAGRAATIVFKFLEKLGDVGQIVEAEFLPPMSRSLEFENVSLKEPGTGRPLLDRVTLRVAAGERVGIVGQEDIEKHALVYLLPRFLDPQAGEIRIDGHDIRWVTLESLRIQVALVLQHNYVFNDTVANNIGCGDSSYTLPQIMEAAKTAHAHNFIQKLPQGYETRIGELGHNLSLGEQFRIALARAILRDPALVIIEEPFASLDEHTKNMVDDTYARFLPERTTILLPHRLSTIKSCDRLYLLNRGQIEATGIHRDLLQESDLYRHIQYLEFNVFAEQS